MKYLIHFALVSVIFAMGIFNNVLADLSDKDDEILLPRYTNVDVEIMYDSNGTDLYENVNVFDKTQNEKPCLVISNIDLERSEILFLEGIRATIYDHDSGKLLKIYTSCK